MKVHNPLFCADMPDPDVIRVGEDYYMVSTTMFYMPAVPILKSKDLVNWKIVSYVCSQIEDNEIYRLEHGKHAYGKGQWATSLMQYEDRFYACFVCNDMQKTYLFSTDDIEKSNWNKVKIDGIYHDMSFLRWENKVYLVYGNGDIRIVEWKKDFSGLISDSDRLLFATPKEGVRLRCEGCRAYVKDGYIYLFFIDWPADTRTQKGLRREVCYRSEKLMGPYECRTILYDDMWMPGNGIAQGPIFEDRNGNWYAMMFQDSGAVGRVPFLMPVTWQNGWPVLGADGKVPETFEIPFQEEKTEALIQSDDFNYKTDQLKKVWQWNHNPDNLAWSITERPGFLRLKNKTQAGDLLEARNTLTQRTQAPGSMFSVELDCTGMKDGDYAGLCAIVEKYGQIGVRRQNGKNHIVMKHRTGEKAPFHIAFQEGPIHLKHWYGTKEVERVFEGNKIWLKIIFRFDGWKGERETAEFFYSTDGKVYQKLGETLELFYSLSTFVGCRIGIFSYNERSSEGGCSDFCNFVFQEC